jgi:hypothetical protein
MWSIIAPIAGSLVGGVLNRKQAKKERDAHFVNLRNSAIAGGFNPLTVLNATGGGGYGQYAAALSRSPLGDAAFAAGDAIAAKSVRNETMQHEVSLEKMRQKHEAKLSRASMDAFNAGMEKVRTSIDIAGKSTTPHEGWSDAEEVEQRYGDVIGPIYGAGVLVADTVSSLNRAAENSDFWSGFKTSISTVPGMDSVLGSTVPPMQPAPLTRERQFTTSVTMPPDVKVEDLPSHWRQNTLRLW